MLAPRSRGVPGALVTAGAMVAVSSALILSAVREKSATFDEIAHLTAGYSCWTNLDYRLQPESGNLPQRWESLPLLTGEFSFPSLEQSAWWYSNLWEISRQFFFESGNDANAMLFRGRVMVVLVTACLNVLVYSWSRRLFGPQGGMVSLILCAFCPTVLAHGGLATADMMAAVFFTASLWSVQAAWHRVSCGTLLVSGVALGGLFLSKMSFVLILPVAGVLLAVRVASGRPLEVTWLGGHFRVLERGHQLAALLLVIVGQMLIVSLLIWSAYGFRYRAFHVASEGEFMPAPGVWFKAGVLSDCLRFARDRHLLPESFLHGVAYISLLNQQRPGFLNGEFSTTGFTAFFPYCLLVKTPLSLFGLLVMAAAGVCASVVANGRKMRELLYDTAPLTVFFVVYWAFALTSGQNVGVRHLLPIFPALFVLAGAAGRWLRPPITRAPFVLTACLLALYVAEAFTTWPNYLSYFNVLAGGPRNGYRHLVDSSLDWGQDLPALKEWLHRKGLDNQTDTPVYLSYFGTADPEYYGVRAKHLPSFFDWKEHPPEPIRGGVYCISATMLQAVNLPRCPGPWTAEYEERYRKTVLALSRRMLGHSDGTGGHDVPPFILQETREQLAADFQQLRLGRLCAYLRQREPDDQVGYSILIYHLTDEEIEQALSLVSARAW